MSKGVFQVSREIFENPIWDDIPKFRIFFFILGNAVFSSEGVRKGNVHIKRGQFLRSYRNLSNDLEYIENRKIKKYSVSVISRKIDQLVKEERLKIEDTDLGTLFTVVNYDEYQGFERYKNKLGTELEQSWNNDGTELEQKRNNNKNVKNVKNEKKYSRKQVYDENSLYYKMTDYFYKLILKNNPQHKKPNYQKWSDDFRKLVELDNRDKDQVRKVMEFVQTDDFEMKNVLSPSKLRARYDQLFMKANKVKVFEKPSYEVNDGGKSNAKHSGESGDVQLFR